MLCVVILSSCRWCINRNCRSCFCSYILDDLFLKSPSPQAYELLMTMLHTAHDPATETAIAQAASVAHSSFVNNPKYYVLLNGIGVGTVAGTIAIKFWIYAVLD